jgi:hypothetical protein
MPCMCGDTRCGSCGPAQGNSRCGSCGEWQEDHEVECVGGPFAMGEEIRVVRGRLKGAVGTVCKITGTSYGFYSYGKIRWVDMRRVEEGDAQLIRGRGDCQHDDDRCAAEATAQAEAEYEWEQEMEKHEEAIKHLLDEPYWRTEDV